MRRAGKEIHCYEPFGRRALYFGFGCFLLIGAIAFAFYLLGDRSTVGQGQMVFSASFFLGMVFCAIALVATSLRFRLTLSPSGLTLRRAFMTSAMARSDIVGYRKVRIAQGGSNATLFLFSPGRTRLRMRIPCVFEDNDEVMAWFHGLPDLSMQDHMAHAGRGRESRSRPE